MNKHDLLTIWAPEDSPWGCWCKPVLFAHLGHEIPEAPHIESTLDVPWAPPPSDQTALVLDLPEAAAVFQGIALAGKGYRPVPLYNALPPPPVERCFGRLLPPGDVAVVNVIPILQALRSAASSLEVLALPADAPPVFLLDANRGGIGGKPVDPAQFDNRSICFTTDFPSANRLQAHGIRKVLLVQEDRLQPREDLAHVLLRWQEAGIALERMTLHPFSLPRPFLVGRPRWYGAMFQRALAALGLRRTGSGGFGAWMQNS